MEIIQSYIDQIRKNQSLADFLSTECDFDIQYEFTFKDTLDFLLEGSKSNYELEPFARDGAGGVYVLLDNGCVAYIDSEGSAGIVGNSPQSFFSILLNCGCISDFAKFGVLKDKETFLDYYNKLEIPRSESFVCDFIRRNGLDSDPEIIYSLFRKSVMTLPPLILKAINEEYCDSEQLFSLDG